MNFISVKFLFKILYEEENISNFRPNINTAYNCNLINILLFTNYLHISHINILYVANICPNAILAAFAAKRMPSIWTTLQYRRAYKSLIENTIVGGLHLGERHANERGGIATKMSLSVPPHAYFDDPTITFHASFRVVHPREFASPSLPAHPLAPFYIPSVQFSERFPPGKFRYTRRRTVTREIKAAPFTCPAFQYVSTLSSTDLAPDSAFDFAREGVARRDVSICTFRANLQTTLEIYAVLAGASPREQKNSLDGQLFQQSLTSTMLLN